MVMPGSRSAVSGRLLAGQSERCPWPLESGSDPFFGEGWSASRTRLRSRSDLARPCTYGRPGDAGHADLRAAGSVRALAAIGSDAGGVPGELVLSAAGG